MIIMSQEVNGKQKVSENNRPYATTATAKRFSSTSDYTEPVYYRFGKSQLWELYLFSTVVNQFLLAFIPIYLISILPIYLHGTATPSRIKLNASVYAIASRIKHGSSMFHYFRCFTRWQN